MTDTTWQIVASVAGQTFYLTEYHITGGAFGSTGHATVRTSLSRLAALKIDLYALSSSVSGGVPFYIYVYQGSGKSSPLFGGEYTSAEFDFDKDSVVIHARDWSGILADQKRILSKIGTSVEQVLAPLAIGKSPTGSGISGENQKLSQIVTSIAKEFGFSPVINLTAANDKTQGALYGSANQTFMPIPQTLWNVLNQLARDTGNEVYVTPTKQLVFGPPGAGQSTIQFSWKQNVRGMFRPCGNLRVTHHPRRNSTFRVLILSYFPSSRQMVTGRAVAIGGNMAGQGGMSPGIYSGTNAVAAEKSLATLKKGATANQVPLYTLHIDGLSADQANQKAAAVATDIAKRELTCAFRADIVQAILPTCPMQFVSPSLPSFVTGAKFFASGYTHTYKMSSQGESGGGLVTMVQGLNLPIEGLQNNEDG